MELQFYLRILIGKWWLVLSTLLITFVAVVLFTFDQTPVYQSTATYVVKVHLTSPDDKTFVNSLNVLMGQTQVEMTFAEVASSRLIKEQSANALKLSREQVRDLSVSSRPVAGTNVIQIAVEGPDPVLVRDFVSVVGAQTALYAQGLYTTFELQPLDGATLPSSPIKPKITLNLMLGALAGLAFGTGLALVSHYLLMPARLGNRSPKKQILPRTRPAK